MQWRTSAQQFASGGYCIKAVLATDGVQMLWSWKIAMHSIRRGCMHLWERLPFKCSEICWRRSGEGSRAERYKDMIGLQKKKSDELTKGAKVEDLYSEAKPVSAANTKPGHKEAFKYDE